LNFSEIPFTYRIYRAQKLLLFIRTTAALGNNVRVNENLRITVELEITSQAANFIKQILSLLAYAGSSIGKTLYQTSCGEWFRVEVEISHSVGGFPVDFCDYCRLFPDDQNIKKDNLTL
jgi:hypothetical protein